MSRARLETSIQPVHFVLLGPFVQMTSNALARERPVVHRLATADDSQQASSLIRSSFLTLSAADWEPDARDRFLNEASAETLQKRIPLAAYAGCATMGSEFVGFIFMPKPSHVANLFVSPDATRLGIGHELWERARLTIEARFPDVHTVELNATSFSVPFYQELGFAPISAPFTLRGCRAVRMACWLPARELGCSLPRRAEASA